MVRIGGGSKRQRRCLIVNSVCGIGSTGRICAEIAKAEEAAGSEVRIAYGRGCVPEDAKKFAVRIGGDVGVWLHVAKTRLFDRHGFGSAAATAEFLSWADRFDPDLLWLHNIHGYYINVEMLFDWIKSRPDMTVKWTLHDCWAFTGHCVHFTAAGCEKWQTLCGRCPQTRTYPCSLFADNSRKNFERKKAAFTGVNDMTLIVPSHWLAEKVEKSFLKDYPLQVVYNTADPAVFKPTDGDFRKRYGLCGKKIVLGVASAWSERKGLSDFFKLRGMLGEDYAVVLVGLTKRQKRTLPEGVLGITRTDSAASLAEIYTAADVFVNTSKEETFGMTTLEASMCGTNTVVYENTACAEVMRGRCFVVPQDIGALCAEIKRICEPKG